jgi:hypothetical protein
MDEHKPESALNNLKSRRYLIHFNHNLFKTNNCDRRWFCQICK